jgi:hypothetical protein
MAPGTGSVPFLPQESSDSSTSNNDSDLTSSKSGSCSSASNNKSANGNGAAESSGGSDSNGDTIATEAGEGKADEVASYAWKPMAGEIFDFFPVFHHLFSISISFFISVLH